MVSYMQTLYDLILGQLEQKRSMKNKELFEDVTAFIDENLAAYKLAIKWYSYKRTCMFSNKNSEKRRINVSNDELRRGKEG